MHTTGHTTDFVARRTGEHGFSLLEVAIATVLVVVVMGAVLSLATRQGAERRATLEASLALGAILSNLEQVRTVPADTLPALDGSGFDVPGRNGEPGGLTALPGDADGLPGELRVTVDQALAGATLYRVRASVAWRGASGRQRMTLETLVGERR